MPFILILRKCWEEYVVKEVKHAGDEENSKPTFKLSAPTRHCKLSSLMLNFRTRK